MFLLCKLSLGVIFCTTHSIFAPSLFESGKYCSITDIKSAYLNFAGMYLEEKNQMLEVENNL